MSQPLRNRLVVTSGATREWIDPVRFISNPSTGAMGWAIATAGLRRFEEVVYIPGHCSPGFGNLDGALNHPVTSTEEMLEAVLRSTIEGSVLVMAAAPADYTPVHTTEHKIKKDPIRNLVIELRPTPDILMAVAERGIPDCTRVGFAAETDNLIANAAAKLQKKDLDYICANRVFRETQGFAVDSGTLIVLDRNGNQTTLGPESKIALGEELIGFLVRSLSPTPSRIPAAPL
ncbi:MAG: phosphopantothenoylcysteine decarboxylase [Leptospirales bacterium]|nr:phosphopantothenoylcysteine decarboxylase [Leptospirales bacterium]